MVFRAMAAVVGISAKFFSAPSASLRDSFLSSAEKTRFAQRRGGRRDGAEIERRFFMFIIHGAIMPQPAKSKKPTVGF